MLELLTVKNIKPDLPYVNGSLQGLSEKRRQKLLAGVNIGIERKIYDDILDTRDITSEQPVKKGKIVAPLWALAHAYAESEAAREVLSFQIVNTATYISFDKEQNTATIIHQPLQNSNGELRFGKGFFYDRQHYSLALSLAAEQLPLEVISGLHLEDFVEHYQTAAQFLFLMNEQQLKNFTNRIIKGCNPLINLSTEQDKAIMQLTFGAYKGNTQKYYFGIFDSGTNEDTTVQYITLEPIKNNREKMKTENKINAAVPIYPYCH